MPTPFFRLLYTHSGGARNLNVLLAASGSMVFCFNRTDGSLLSKWSHASSLTNAEDAKEQNDSEPPPKRRRVSIGEREASEAPSAEIIVDNENAERPRREKKRRAPRPSVIKLRATSDGKHVVVVTGEDKTLRVLELSDGALKQVSERQMPKKPSAITLTPDESTILVADKFGDVYGLPLLYIDEPKSPAQMIEKSATTEPVARKPAATSLTVHTRKNLLALENQLKAKVVGSQKKTIDFEHQLLLGHVSLLTDIVSVVQRVDGRDRHYVLTADRDEHIRITRGIPQTHVIEAFCQGHDNFVNNLLVPGTRPELLISGGGDDYLMLWDWTRQKIFAKTSLIEHVNSVRLSLVSLVQGAQEALGESADRSKIAVSGLWAVSVQVKSGEASATDIIATCEAVPAIFVFRLEADDLRHGQTIALPGNPLDVSVDDHTTAMMVSMDNVHQAGSASQADVSNARPFLQVFNRSPKDGKWQPGGSDLELERVVNGWTKHSSDGDDLEPSVLSEQFYGIEHLRKRTGGEAEMEDQE